MSDNSEQQAAAAEEQPLNDEALESVAGGASIGIGGPKLPPIGTFPGPIVMPTIVKDPFPIDTTM